MSERILIIELFMGECKRSMKDRKGEFLHVALMLVWHKLCADGESSDCCFTAYRSI